MQEYDDIMQAVNSFVAHHNPPLKPAFETQTSLTNSITDTPPSYNQAQSALQVSNAGAIPDGHDSPLPLQPEVAPLPQISGIIAQPEGMTNLLTYFKFMHSL